MSSTFSYDLKSELSNVNVTTQHCRRAELAGLIFSAAAITVERGGVSLIFHTEHTGVVNCFFSLLKKLYGTEPQLYRINANLKKNMTYEMRVTGVTARTVMDDCGYSDAMGGDYSVVYKLIEKDCCRQSFLRGTFLGCGTINDPNKSYSLEFVFNSYFAAEPAENVLERLGITVRYNERKDDHVLYMRDSESIVSVLSFIGGVKSLLAIENIKIYKEINNDINRAYNFDSANINRAIVSASEQIDAIEKIKSNGIYDSLPRSVREAAEVRLENPEASLGDIAAILEISKSAVNHRMRKLREVADSL